LAKSIFGVRTKVWSRRLRGFWEEFSHNKIGLFGLVILAIYGAVAIFAPVLTPYDPTLTKDLANPFAQPEWMTIFPQFRSLPRTTDIPMEWTVIKASNAASVIKNQVEELVVLYDGTGSHSINITTVYLYPYSAPKEFLASWTWWSENVSAATYHIEFAIRNPSGLEFSIWSNPGVWSGANQTWISASIYSSSSEVRNRLGMTFMQNPATEIFNEPGEYRLILRMWFRPVSPTRPGTAKMHFENAQIRIKGLVHGILGTDSVGGDVFSQLIYGSQISLAIGLSSALLATVLGLSVGISAGYIGGFVDEGLMRIVDILLCLPVLPLLLGLINLFGTSVWYLVLLLAVFGWQGLSRLIRSVVLSLKERPFIECARAAGASKFYIMVRHMVPNVLPVAMAALVLAVPAAIITEAAISFIGFGDPSAPSWGRMLNYAFNNGAFSALAWWWVIPPGLAITTITLGFVFVGHAVDEVVNPRLRRRR